MTRGTGYTKATVIVNSISSDEIGREKFIGYIPTKDEYIIASKFEGNGYGWTKYFRVLSDLIDHLREKGQHQLACDVLEEVTHV